MQGFRTARGPWYTGFFERLHQKLLFDWYMEIGCRKGRSFAPARSKTIAVDPYFRANLNIIRDKPQLHVFQQTSDDFFASGFMEKNAIRLGLSFLDGMHLYEYLLRDVMNTEAASDPNGVIVLHDCVPSGFGMTTRDLDNLPRRSTGAWKLLPSQVRPNAAWTGDVWKLIPILQKYRSDLTLTVLDCAPTGLVCLSNLSPDNTVLRDRQDEIRAEWDRVDLAQYGLARFQHAFAFTAADACERDGFQLFRPASIDEGLALRPILRST
jgi:hypothetical protein